MSPTKYFDDVRQRIDSENAKRREEGRDLMSKEEQKQAIKDVLESTKEERG